MRWLRLLLALLKARYRSKLSVNDSSVILFSVWLTDVDATIMNHAALMTVMEAGRMDLMVRTGFQARKKRKMVFPYGCYQCAICKAFEIISESDPYYKGHSYNTNGYLSRTESDEWRKEHRCMPSQKHGQKRKGNA